MDLQQRAAYYKAILASPNTSPSTRIQVQGDLDNLRKQYVATLAAYEADMRAAQAGIESSFKIIT